MAAICRTVPFVSVVKRAVGFCHQTITLQKCVMWRVRLGLYQQGCFPVWKKECLIFLKVLAPFKLASAAVFYCQIWLTVVKKTLLFCRLLSLLYSPEASELSWFGPVCPVTTTLLCCWFSWQNFFFFLTPCQFWLHWFFWLFSQCLWHGKGSSQQQSETVKADHMTPLYTITFNVAVEFDSALFCSWEVGEVLVIRSLKTCFVVGCLLLFNSGCSLSYLPAPWHLQWL